MLYRGVVCICVLAVMLVPGLVAAQAEEVKEYKVTKGDTLWGISGKELSDTFLWPKVWKENSNITNPDRIYPGQTIKIPLYLLQKEKQETRSGQPAASSREEVQTSVKETASRSKVRKSRDEATLSPLVDRSLLMASGYIAENMDVMGKITGSPDEHHLFGKNDMVYVKVYKKPRIGDKFYVVRKGAEVTHPETGKSMGFVVEIRGIVEITEFVFGETKAKVIQMFEEIEESDFLDAYYEITPPLTAGSFRKPDVKAVVVATSGLKTLNGPYDIVYLDKGQNAGLEPGDILQTIKIGNHTIPNALIQIISQKPSTSTAIVRTFSDTVSIGNKTLKAE